MSIKLPACTRIAGDLVAAAIGEANADAEQRVERHLAVCGPCRREFTGYRTADRLAAALRADPLP